MQARELEVQVSNIGQFGQDYMTPCLITKSKNKTNKDGVLLVKVLDLMSWITIELPLAPSLLPTVLSKTGRIRRGTKFVQIPETMGPGKEIKHSTLQFGKHRMVTDTATLSHQTVHKLWGSIIADSKTFPRGLGMVAWSNFRSESIDGVKNKGILKIQF